MTQKICILILITLGFQTSQAFASHPLEGFFGSYQVIEPRMCEADDSWCNHLQKVYIGFSSSDPNKAVITEYGPETQPSRTTVLVEIPCSDLGSCPEFANIEGLFPMAGWSYIKNVPSTSFEKHDYQTFSEDRKFQGLSEFTSYDYASTISKGADFSTVSTKRAYRLKRL